MGLKSGWDKTKNQKGRGTVGKRADTLNPTRAVSHSSFFAEAKMITVDRVYGGLTKVNCPSVLTVKEAEELCIQLRQELDDMAGLGDYAEALSGRKNVYNHSNKD